ncbi:MAG: DUF6702 family protein [Flavobacteriales bacterium]
MKILALSIALFLAPLHEFHSSVMQIDHNAKSKTLQITVRLFTDDLCVALENAGAPKMELGTQSEPPSANEHLESYLKKHVAFTVNGKEAAFKYLGKEAQLDATWCYLEIEKVGNVRKLEVVNKLMLSEFDDQTNLVNLNIDGRKKSGIGRKSVSKLKFEF